MPDQDAKILAAARELARVWRAPNPNSWRSTDEIPVGEALERLCREVEADHA